MFPGAVLGEVMTISCGPSRRNPVPLGWLGRHQLGPARLEPDPGGRSLYKHQQGWPSIHPCILLLEKFLLLVY